MFGVERKILLTKTSHCGECKGNGAKTGSEIQICGQCNGKGKIHETKRSFLGSISVTKTCGICNGLGKISKEKCSSCKGSGVIRKEEEIPVRIPFGIDDGEMVRLAGAGEAVSGGVSGDLYIKIHVKKHPIFKKEGNDLICNLQIKLSDALLGYEHNFSTLDGDVKLKIPAGISFGETLRIKGKGVPVDKNRRGDLLIKIQIQLPGKLTKEAEKLIQSLKKQGI